MTKPLKTLKDFNAEQIEAYRRASEPQPNGIACPECGQELKDTNSGCVLDSYPPQVGVFCECGWKGTRFQ